MTLKQDSGKELHKTAPCEQVDARGFPSGVGGINNEDAPEAALCDSPHSGVKSPCVHQEALLHRIQCPPFTGATTSRPSAAPGTTPLRAAQALSRPGFDGDLEARMMSWREEMLSKPWDDRRSTPMS
jgi:hypothetical protein